MDEALRDLLQQTVARYVDPKARIVEVESGPMSAHEQGYSGATLQRHTLRIQDTRGVTTSTTLITKEAPLLERRVLQHLHGQQQCVPFSHTLDTTTDAPMLVCQQDLGGDEAPAAPADLARHVARCLASIHAANRGRRDGLGWLPPADHAYMENVILADWRAQLQQAMRYPAFVAEYDALVPEMERAATSFLADMDALWADDDVLTLIHADMQDAHVIPHTGHAYVVDWGQARYGSLYLDLPNYFTPDEALLYRDALAERGHAIPTDLFLQRYHQATRYPGFKYIGFVLHTWRPGQAGSLYGPLLDMVLQGR